jgi:predicted permease
VYLAEMLEQVMRPFAALFVFFLGFILGSTREGRRVSNIIAKLLLYLFIPAIIIYKVASTQLGIIVQYAVLVTAVFWLTLGSAAILVPRILREYSEKTIGAAILAAGIHNSGFLPIPLMLMLYGDAGPAALYSTIASIHTSIIVPIIVGLYRAKKRNEEGSVARIVLRSIIAYPPFIALLTGLASREFMTTCPDRVVSTLPSLYAISAEATLISFYLVGAALRQSGLGLDKPVLLITLWRLIVEPIITLIVILSVNPAIGELWIRGLIIESFMPPATMNIVVAVIYGLDYKVVAKSIGISTPFSIALALLQFFIN